MPHASKTTVGAMVVRFQDEEIHEGQRAFVQSVAARHDEVLFILGSTGGAPTARDPLPFDVRRMMIEEVFPDMRKTIIEMLDHPLDHRYWSEELDALVLKTVGGRPVTLYGGRDSFLKHYTGTLPAVELPAIGVESGTKRRSAIRPRASSDFRAGMIYANTSAFAHTYPTVDLGVIDRKRERVLMGGRKREQGLLRFIGGFAERTTETYEEDAGREGSEEIPGIRFSPPRYIGSRIIDDRRYRESPDGIKTLLFIADYQGGETEGGDDLDYVEWVHRDELFARVVPCHRPLVELLLASWKRPWYRRLFEFLKRQ